MGAVFFLVVAILDVIAAWALYILLAPVNQGFSLLAAWFRVVYAAIYATTIIQLFNALISSAGQASRRRSM